MKFDEEKFLKVSKKKMFTQSKFAEEADTSIRYIRDVEKGEKDNPSASMLYRFKCSVGVTMESLKTLQEERE